METNQNYQEIQNKIEEYYPLFVAMPSWLFCDARLKAAEKMLLVLVHVYKAYRPNYDEIEWIIGITKRTAQQSLRGLEQLGFIETVKNDGRGKTYRLTRSW